MSIVRAAIPLAIGTAGARGLSLILRIMAAASLSIVAYSEYTLKVALFISLIPLSTLSVSYGLSRLSSDKEKENLNACAVAALYLVAAFSILSTIIFYILIPDEALNTNCYLLLTCVLMGLMSHGITSISAGVSMAQLNIKKAGKIELIDAALKLTSCGLILITKRSELIDIFYAYAASSVITAFVFWPKLKLDFSIHKNITIAISLVKKCAAYSACSLITLLLFYQVREALYLLDKVLAAQLDFAIMLYAIPKIIMASIVRTSIPLHNSGSYSGISIKQLAALSTICGMCALIIIVSASSSMLISVFGLLSVESYSAALTPLSIFVLGAAFDLAYGVKSGMLFSRNRQWITLTACIITAIVLYAIISPIIEWAALSGAAAIMSSTYIILLLTIFTIEKIVGE